MDFNLRKLKSEDIFPMFRIMGKIGFSDLKNKLTPEMITKMTQGVEGQDLTTMVGFNIIMEVAEVVIINIPKCEKEIYEFLSSLSGMKVDEIREISPADFMELIIAVFRKEEFKDFFKVVSGLFN